jgi:prevent-host-death family protein
MTQVNLYEAKTQLSKLVDRAAAGEDIVIAKNGQPVAVLVAPEKAQKPARRVPEFGFLKDAWPPMTSEEWDKMWAESDAYVLELFEKSANEDL